MLPKLASLARNKLGTIEVELVELGQLDLVVVILKVHISKLKITTPSPVALTQFALPQDE